MGAEDHTPDGHMAVHDYSQDVGQLHKLFGGKPEIE